MLKPNDIKQFSEWIVRNNGEVLDCTSQWEVIRYRVPSEGVFVIYQNKAGKQKLTDRIAEHVSLFEGNKLLSIVKRPRGKDVKVTIRAKLAERDGLECWYCRDTEAKLTLEHILAVSCGGSNHMANFALACEPCNIRVGSLPIVEKFAWRMACERSPEPIWQDDQTDPNYVPWFEGAVEQGVVA